jgi:ABC-2 type transport system permease protein
MRKTVAVAKMMFRITAMNKAFVIITLIGPFLIGAVAVLPGLLTASGAGMPDQTEVGIVSTMEDFPRQLEAELQGSPVVLREFNSVEEARAAAESRDIAGYLKATAPPHETGSYSYFSRTGTDITSAEALEQALGSLASRARLQEMGVDPAVLSALRNTPDLQMMKIGGSSGSSGYMSVMFTAIGFVMLLYMTVLLYGQMIGRSVVQEKTNKTVEIMLSSVRPAELMYGKIFGIGIAGLLQYAVWFLLAALVLTFLSSLGINTPELISARLFGTLLLYFLPAFLLYAAAFAAMGAASEDEQHLGQLSTPLILFLVLPLVLIGALVMNPGSVIAQILSYFPFTAPIVMFIRVMVETPPFWQQLLSYLIVLITIALTAGFGGKIFRIGILLTGKRPSIGEVLRWMKSA